jgi:hypothetical protein
MSLTPEPTCLWLDAVLDGWYRKDVDALSRQHQVVTMHHLWFCRVTQ